MVDANNFILTYRLDSDSGATESSPEILAPTTNPGSKRWIRQHNFRDRISIGEYSDSLATAIANAGILKRTVYIDTNISLASNVIDPNNLSMEIGKNGIVHLGNYNLTIWGDFECPSNHQAFVYDGTGTVTFKNRPPVAHPGWWGVKADGATDDTTALQSAINCGLGCYQLPQGIIKLTSSVVLKNPMRLIGSGHITDVSGVGTLIWEDTNVPAIYLNGHDYNIQDSYLANFDIVSEGDGIKLYESHRNTIQDVQVKAGTKGWGFVLDGSYENRLIACTATTNGYSPHTYTTGYAGHFAGGFRLYKGAASYGPNASELINCIASCGGTGVYIGDIAAMYANIYGGTFEGNDYNLHIKSVTLPVNIHGSHFEAAEVENIKLESVSDIHFYGIGAMGTGLSNQSVEMVSATNCTFSDSYLGYVAIDANCRDNIFKDCTAYHTYFEDAGIGTEIINLKNRSTDEYGYGNRTDVGVANLVTNEDFERWADPNTPCDSIEQTCYATKEGTIIKFGTYSAKIESNGTYSGLRYNDLGAKLKSSYLTISFWLYVPTGATGNFGIRVYGLDTSCIVWDSAAAIGFDSWKKKQYTVYVGSPGSARRSGSIDVAVICAGDAVGSTGYIDGLAVCDGRNQANIPDVSAVSIVTNRITSGSIAPASGGYIQGDVVLNSAPDAGEPSGWMCTVSGSPGTWVATGQVGYRSGSGAPSVNANFVGEDYLDTGASKWYKSISTGSGAGDWVALN
ncbi:MAG: hypothetical protein AB1847_21180 [bacterium]